MATGTKANHAKGGKALNFPTTLTLFRILLVAPVMINVFIDTPAARITTIVCFVVASATDFADGWLARKNKQVTKLGKFLDPLADKMLVNLTFLALVTLKLMPVWMFAIILIRDFAVDGLRMMAAGAKITIAASRLGKLKTLVQMIVVVLILANTMIQNHIFSVINLMLLYVVVILTVISGADYLYKGRRLVL